jgi:hypothetical protein
MVNAFKSFNAVTLIFLLISFYLTRQESNYAIVLGYISIVWWSLILLINIYKIQQIDYELIVYFSYHSLGHGRSHDV